MNKIKVAFLNRDGTITKEYQDEEWKNSGGDNPRRRQWGGI